MYPLCKFELIGHLNVNRLSYYNVSILLYKITFQLCCNNFVKRLKIIYLDSTIFLIPLKWMDFLTMLHSGTRPAKKNTKTFVFFPILTYTHIQNSIRLLIYLDRLVLSMNIYYFQRRTCFYFATPLTFGQLLKTLSQNGFLNWSIIVLTHL